MPETGTTNDVIKDSKDLIETIVTDEFDSRVLQAAGPIVVEFMSHGCSHCQELEPVLQKVAKTLDSKERFVRVDVETNRELAESHQIQGTPTLILFLNGKQVGRVDGPQPNIESLLTAVTKPFEK